MRSVARQLHLKHFKNNKFRKYIHKQQSLPQRSTHHTFKTPFTYTELLFKFPVKLRVSKLQPVEKTVLFQKQTNKGLKFQNTNPNKPWTFVSLDQRWHCIQCHGKKQVVQVEILIQPVKSVRERSQFEIVLKIFYCFVLW